ncbi:hypothetical protein Tco_0954185, partial [Tanacetum coccineum]
MVFPTVCVKVRFCNNPLSDLQEHSETIIDSNDDSTSSDDDADETAIMSCITPSRMRSVGIEGYTRLRKALDSVLFNSSFTILSSSFWNPDIQQTNRLNIDPILEDLGRELAHIAPIPPGIVEADFNQNDDTSSDDD